MTKTAFETELSETFAARVAEIRPEAVERLRAVDYRPRRHHPARSLAVGGGSVAGAVTTGTVLAVVLGGTAPAYAGWSATPLSTSGSTPSANADSSCQSQLVALQSPGSSTGTWQPVLTDVRGPFTVALFQADNSYAACFTGSSFTEKNELSNADVSSGAGSGASSGVLRVSGHARNGTGGPPTVELGSTNTNSLRQVVQSHLSTAADGPFTLVGGRAQPGVTGVTLVSTTARTSWPRWLTGG